MILWPCSETISIQRWINLRIWSRLCVAAAPVRLWSMRKVIKGADLCSVAHRASAFGVTWCWSSSVSGLMRSTESVWSETSINVERSCDWSSWIDQSSKGQCKRLLYRIGGLVPDWENYSAAIIQSRILFQMPVDEKRRRIHH